MRELDERLKIEQGLIRVLSVTNPGLDIESLIRRQDLVDIFLGKKQPRVPENIATLAGLKKSIK